MPEDKELRSEIFKAIKRHEGIKLQGVLVDVIASEILALIKPMSEEDKVTKILKLLDDVDGFAADSRGCYENARGNDSACYEATNKIRELLKE